MTQHNIRLDGTIPHITISKERDKEKKRFAFSPEKVLPKLWVGEGGLGYGARNFLTLVNTSCYPIWSKKKQARALVP